MLGFIRDFMRTESVGADTGTYPDALLNMTELQKEQFASIRDGHGAFKRDYGTDRKVIRSSLGFA